MDFQDTAEEAAFRSEAQDWLKPTCRARMSCKDLSYMEQCKLWQKRKYDAGWACIRWPKEFGGARCFRHRAGHLNQEEAKFDVPTGVFASVRAWLRQR